jgi:gamma-glutamyltranspeptidase / glutathione hydrolase
MLRLMPKLSRRQMIHRTGLAFAAGAVVPAGLMAESPTAKRNPHGVVSGQPQAEMIGARVLADGGNAVDAVVAAALTAAVAAPHHTGIGGYGGHMVIAQKKGGKITAIDFNSAAPGAARAEMFAPNEKGNVPGAIHQWGWLAAGVPGILAGMQLALERYGTRSFRECVGPAIDLARDGIPLAPVDVSRLNGCAKQFRPDQGSRKLYFGGGDSVAAGAVLRNPDLAAMLTTLAERNSADSFYRGDIAQHIAEGFKKNGGLVTADDLAAYHAREVEPLAFAWKGCHIHTAPLTAGGLTVLQALTILRALNWDTMPADFARTHARIESLRFAWHDRLRLLGDPEKTDVPIAKLLSDEYAREAAAQIQRVVKEGTILPLETTPRKQTGTVHLSAVDRDGNMAACTLTHGGSFGARVTVDGLGLTLGHGMSRFDPHPGHPNAPGPGKRPLHNMCPTIVVRDGHPVLACGARGGRQIPNSVFEVLTQFVVLGKDMRAAVAAPRFETEGNRALQFEKTWPTDETEAATRIGYQIKTGLPATLSAVSFDARTGECGAALR